MLNKNVTVKNNIAGERSVAMLVQIANEYECGITLHQANITVNCKSIMGMLTLNIENGLEIGITTEGPDEEIALKRIEDFLTTNN